MKTAQEYLQEAREKMIVKEATKKGYPGLGFNAGTPVIYMDPKFTAFESALKHARETNQGKGTLYQTNELCDERLILRNAVNRLNKTPEFEEVFSVEFYDDHECAQLSLRVK